MSDEYVSSAEAAKLLGLARGTLPAWRSKGEGPAFYRFGRSIRYRRSELEAWAADRRREAIRAQVAETRARDGLPRHVEDPAVLDRVAAMVAGGGDDRG